MRPALLVRRGNSQNTDSKQFDEQARFVNVKAVFRAIYSAILIVEGQARVRDFERKLPTSWVERMLFGSDYQLGLRSEDS